MSATVPAIVASQAWNGQTSALAQTAVFTPSASGLYRLTVYLSVESGSGGATPHFYWTDDAGSQTRQFDPSNTSFPVSYSMLVKAASGDAISVSVGVTGTNTYDLYAVVESL